MAGYINVEKVSIAVLGDGFVNNLSEDAKAILSKAKRTIKNGIVRYAWNWTESWGDNGGDEILDFLDEKEIDYAFMRIGDTEEGDFIIEAHSPETGPLAGFYTADAIICAADD